MHGLCGYCQSKLGQRQHQHLQIRKDFADTCSATSIAELSPLYALPMEPEDIIPLQTLRVSVQDEQGANVLLQTYWKRQLVGKLLVYDCNASDLTSQIRLDCPTDVGTGDALGLVESLTATPVQDRMSHSNGKNAIGSRFYLVLPSTRITIVTSPFPLTGLYSNASAPSLAAKTLLEALRCIMEGKNTPRFFLLTGGPGTGKTFSVRWAWQEAQRLGEGQINLSLCSLRGSELLQNTNPAMVLEKEFQKSNVWHDAMPDDGTTVAKWRPSVTLIFLDECDALVSAGPIASMLADLLDRVDKKWKTCVVVGATNRIDSVPSFLRRPGRFEREIPLSPPEWMERTTLLKSLIRQVNTKAHSSDPRYGEIGQEEVLQGISDEEVRSIAEVCVGYTPADLSALVRKAWLLSLKDPEAKTITFSHLKMAQPCVGASALRDALLWTPTKMDWDDIAGDPGGAKAALRQAIDWPRLRAKEFGILGLQPPRGILLHGPPGCAKTTLARAAAGASGVAFLSLSPAQVYASSYVGEAEAVVRRAFALARSAAPCILFFDEIDSIFGSSEGVGARGNSAEARVLSTFLNEMDGVDISGAGKDGVLVLGATNRPWTLDAALLRPGRLGDKIIFLPPPDAQARRAILQMQFEPILKSMEGNEVWDWDMLVDLSKQMTGAELVGACQETKVRWMQEEMLWQNESAPDEQGSVKSLLRCCMEALESIKPILSDPQSLDEFRVFQHDRNASS
ncbi:MAG: hypothetical protein SGILL_005895 [Bacillariaceae sp.]